MADESDSWIAGFTAIPNFILGEDLSPVARLMYGVLFSAEEGRTTGELVKRLGVNRRSIYRHGRELEEAGWALTRQGRGQDRTKTYFAVIP